MATLQYAGGFTSVDQVSDDSRSTLDPIIDAVRPSVLSSLGATEESPIIPLAYATQVARATFQEKIHLL